MSQPTTIKIDDVEYVRSDSIINLPDPQTDSPIGHYCIVRCRNAGVHAGIVTYRDRDVVRLASSRRLWKWWSKFTLSGLATTGVLRGKDDECHFACVLPFVELTASDVCEIIPCSDIARKSITGIKEWSNE